MFSQFRVDLLNGASPVPKYSIKRTHHIPNIFKSTDLTILQNTVLARKRSDETIKLLTPSSKLSFNRQNCHASCSRVKRPVLHVEEAVVENDLISPVIVRNTRELKAKPVMPKSAKKRIIQSFENVRNEFFESTPMDVEYDLLHKKYEQHKRDKVHQGRNFGQPVSAAYFSRSLLRAWNQIQTMLTMQDHFTINLTKQDLHHYLKRQPKVLVEQIDLENVATLQRFMTFDEELNYHRKKSLIEKIFADKQLSHRDREVLYQILINLVQGAIKNQERLERVGLTVINKQKNIQLEALRLTLQFINENYAKLVKLL